MTSATTSATSTSAPQAKATPGRWSGSLRAFIVCYIAFAFLCRILLRSPCVDGYHWILIMILEDGMSVMSFIMGLLLLHCSNGEPLSFLTKCITAPCEESSEEAEPSEESTESAGTLQMRQRIKLFAFAM